MTIAVLALIAAATPIPAPALGEMKVFQDWYVACDNVWSCEAGTLAPEEGGDFTGAMALRIHREGGPDAPFRIELRPGEDDAPGVARLSIDSRRPIGGTLDADGDSWLDGGDVRDIARRIANGKTASLVLANDKTVVLSLAGSSAALRYMDAIQHRAGTTGAIVATGSKPDSALPPPVPQLLARTAPAIDALPDMKDYPQVVAATDCDYRQEGIEHMVFPLDRSNGKDLALALIACDSGAYNFGSVVMIAERPAGKTDTRWQFVDAHFDTIPGWGGEEQAMQVVNADFSPETGMLFERAKGRGIGDCGTASNYAWDGRMFRLSEMHLMDACRGVWDWPRVYSAEVSTAP